MFKNVVFGLSVVAGLFFGGSVVSADTVTYTIQPGDTLSQIAESTGFLMDDIADINNIDDVNVIYAGDVLVLDTQDDANTTAKRNDNGEVSDPDGVVSPAQNETVTPVQEVQAAQVETSQQDVQYDVTDNDVAVYSDDNNANANSVDNGSYDHTDGNGDTTESNQVVSVSEPYMFITPQHTVFYTSEAMPIAGDTSLDGSKVFDGYIWILK